MKRMYFACLAAVTALAAGCVTRVYAPPPAVVVQPAPPPAVAVQPAPPPAVVQAAPPGVTVYVPEYYTWDGYEYVGVCGGQYVYWGGGAWLACDAVILGRFHGWERYHPGWRGSAFRYRRGR